jgi:hypothetical protein
MPILPWIGYVGLVFSALGFTVIPFVVVRMIGTSPPNTVYWALAAVFFLAIAFYLWRAGRLVLAEIRRGVIDLQDIAVFVGFALGALLAALTVAAS